MSGKKNTQEVLSQKDMFGDDDDSDSDSKEQEIKLKFKSNASAQSIQSSLPNVAVPEKIVFCIDSTVDIASGYSFNVPISEQYPSPEAIRNHAIKVFVTNKLSIARDTEFALVQLLPGQAELMSPLSSNIDQLMNCLRDLKKSTESETGDYNITPIFNSVLNIIDIPQEPTAPAIPPPYLIRLILIYGNSFLEPTVSMNNEYYKTFSMSPFCILDVIYLHEKHSDINTVKQIYNCLGNIVLENSYLLENSRNVTTLFNKMAKLLAHPYQRVSQDLWKF